MSYVNFTQYSSKLAHWHFILKQKELKSNWIVSFLKMDRNLFSTVLKKNEPINGQCASSYFNYPKIKPAFDYILFSTKKFKVNFFDSHSQYSSSCELTAKRYPVTRGSFNEVKEADVNFFKSFLNRHQVITSKDELEGPNTDWLRSVKGYSKLMLRPKTTEEVSKILAYCNKQNLSVCPQGGNTGLVGGSVPVFDEIILSTSLMNKVESLDEYSGAVICQSGCVLETLDHFVAEHELMMPLDLGAKGSCQIGGNISTNAGGLRLLRYGSLHGSVLGIEAVLASGQIIDCLSSMKKDNTGYGLKHLFIGSEGTLGIVTKISIHCPVRPVSSTVAFLGLDNFKNVLRTFKEAKTCLGEILTSCEFIDQYSLDAVISRLMLTSPIDRQKFYILIEASGSNTTHDGEKLTRFLEKSMEDGLILDGIVVTEPSKMLEIWGLRERIAEALLLDGYTYKYDVSLPLPVFYEVVEEMQDRLSGHVTRCCGYGHIGDGNLHFNVTTPEYSKDVLDLIEPYFYELTARHQGSISAEHGLGFKKKNFMGYSRSASSIALMKQLKALMDPKGILNPYKLLPEN